MPESSTSTPPTTTWKAALRNGVSMYLLRIHAIADRARRVIEEGRAARGHVFNLGHGILPEVPVEHAKALVAAVKAWGA